MEHFFEFQKLWKFWFEWDKFGLKSAEHRDTGIIFIELWRLDVRQDKRFSQKKKVFAQTPSSKKTSEHFLSETLSEKMLGTHWKSQSHPGSQLRTKSPP